MELPDFSSLWEANDTLEKLESLLGDYSQKNKSNARYPRKRDPETYHNYYSDGICGVSFGIAEPEFANPLATCCEQHFFTAEELDRHRSQHVTCPGLPDVDGSSCGRALHPSVLAFHLETEHSRNVNKVGKDDTSDGVDDAFLKRWREARKKNYPTFERVQAKIREVGYRIDRGQVLLTRKFGCLNSRRPQDLRTLDARGDGRAHGKLVFVNKRPHKEKSVKQNSPLSSGVPRAVKKITEEKSHNKEQLNAFSFKPPGCKESEEPRVVEVSKGKKAENKELRSVFFLEPSGCEEPEDEVKPQVESDSSLLLDTQLQTVKSTDIAPTPLPLVNYDSDISWSEQLEEDAGDKDIRPQVSPVKGKNLLELLDLVQPSNTKSNEGDSAESVAAPTTTLSPFGKRWDKRDRRRMRGRPNRPRRRQRKHRNETEDDAGEGGTDEADAAAEEMEVDEVSVKGGVKAFASHPVVQMFAKRRACMRKTSQITKRPTLLHMLLAEEMRHERNQLMQCVRFVVKNNFFLPQ